MAFSPEKFTAGKSEYKKKKEEKEKIDEGRRNFLRAGLALGAAALAGRGIEELLEKGGKEFNDYNRENTKLEVTPLINNLESELAIAEQDEIYSENMEFAKSVADILDFDKSDPIRLTPEKMGKVKNYWKQRYENKKDTLHKSLVDGYEEWGYWRPYTENRFKSAGVPIHYALLALPESHWKVHARSKAGAVGPYQFMPKTAASLKLKMNRVIDERKDPIKSAEACALVLKELYIASNDWDVALSGYNGSFAWKFIKEAKNNGQATSYENFLTYLEERLNKIKNNLHTNKKFTSLSHKAKREMFAKRISGFCQNLNYPPKFHAVEELIKEGKIKKQQLPINFKEEKIIQTEAAPGQIKHIVAKGETFFGIARKLKIAPQELYRYNRKINIKNLKPGDKLEIPSPKKKNKNNLSGSLLARAKKTGKSEKEMRFLNPHILDAQAPLPNGTVIRV